MLCPANTNSSYSRCGRRRCCRSSRPTRSCGRAYSSCARSPAPCRSTCITHALHILHLTTRVTPSRRHFGGSNQGSHALGRSSSTVGGLSESTWRTRDEARTCERVRAARWRGSACSSRAREGGASVTRSCARARDHHGKARVCNNERHTIMRLKTRMRAAHARGFGRRQI